MPRQNAAEAMPSPDANEPKGKRKRHLKTVTEADAQAVRDAKLKEKWNKDAQAAIEGGYTSLADVPEVAPEDVVPEDPNIEADYRRASGQKWAETEKFLKQEQAVRGISPADVSGEKMKMGSENAQERERVAVEAAIKKVHEDLAMKAVEDLAAEQASEEQEPFGKETTMKPVAKTASRWERIKGWFSGKK